MPALNNPRSAATTSTIEFILYASHQTTLIDGGRFQDDFAVSENGFVAPSQPRLSGRFTRRAGMWLAPRVQETYVKW